MTNEPNQITGSGAEDAPPMRMICPACNGTFEAGIFICAGCGTGLLEIPDAPLLSGSVIDERYDVEGVVGTGGMGSVYRARQRGMERAVAIKVLHAHFAHQPKAVKRFFREARNASSLVHPNIVTVYDFGRSEAGHLYMVMELLEGWTLGDLVHYRAPLSPSVAIAIALQICDALEAAHRQRIVHRDLKPDNVLLSTVEDGLWVKVLDFGIARALRDKDSGLVTQHSTVEIAGTPAYMSPEQILGKAPDPRSDLYSLGVILFEMLTKTRPFDDESSVALCMKQLNEAPPTLQSALGERATGAELAQLGPLNDVVQALLGKKITDRPRAAADVRRMLKACPQYGGPIALPNMDKEAPHSLSNRPTRGDAAELMAQVTLDSSLGARAQMPGLGEVVARFRQGQAESGEAKRGAAGGLVGSSDPDSDPDSNRGRDSDDGGAQGSGLFFPAAPAKVEAAARRHAASLRQARQRPAAGVAQLLAEHPAAIRTGPVSQWLTRCEAHGWIVSCEAQKAIIRAPMPQGAGRGEDAGTAALKESQALVAAVCALQEQVLSANIALRIGVAHVEDGHVAKSMDVSGRLAAAAAHGQVAVSRRLCNVLDLSFQPLSSVFLPDGSTLDCVAVRRPGSPAPTLLWGRGIPLRRLGQLADEARRGKLVRVQLNGVRGMGRTAVARTFVQGRKHLYIRVSPGCAMFPGHAFARLVGEALGLKHLDGMVESLEGTGLVGRDRELAGLLLCDAPMTESPTPRALVSLAAEVLERYAQQGPLTLILDDVEHLDPASADLFRGLWGEASTKPWLVIATDRTRAGAGVASRGAAALLGDAGHQIVLRALSMRGANAVLDAQGVPARKRHAMMASAHGNPLALTLLADAHGRGEHTWIPDKVITTLLPQALRRAEPQIADAAWVSAALGEAAGADAGDGQAHAEHAARLYVESNLSDALVDWLRARLMRLGPVSAAVAQAFGEPSAQARGRVAERLERLGLWQLAAHAHEATFSLVTGDERGTKQLRAAHLRALAGDVSGALDGYAASIRTGADRHRPTALLNFAHVLLDVGEQGRASEVLDHVGEAVDQDASPRAHAELWALKARAAVRVRDIKGAMIALGVARDGAQRLRRDDARSARALEALTQEVRAEVAIAEGDAETARINLRQARDAFRDLGQHTEAIRCLVDLGRVELSAGLNQRACDTFRATERLAAAAGLKREALRAQIGLGEALIAAGELDAGGQRIRQGLRRADALKDTAALAEATLAMAHAMVKRGLWLDARRYAVRAREATPRPGIRARAWLLEARCLIAEGNPRKAARAMVEAEEAAARSSNGLLLRQVRELKAHRSLADRPITHTAVSA